MALRLQLLNPSLGLKIIDVADPIGINTLEQEIKRSKKYDGMIFEIIIDLRMIKEARQYVKQAYEQAGGIDAEVTVIIYEFDPNARKWEVWYTGQVNMNKWELSEAELSVMIEQTGVERRVDNMFATDVDLETIVSENGNALPAQATKEVTYHSKKLFLQCVGTMPQETVNFDYFMIEDTGIDSDPGFISAWLQFTLTATIDEIADRFDYPFYPNRRYPPNLSKFFFKFKEDCELEINLRVVAEVIISAGVNINNDCYYGHYIVYGRPGAYTTITVAEDSIPSNNGTITINELYNNTLSFSKGDEFYYFAKLNMTPAAAIPLTPADIQIKNFLVVGPDTFVNEVNISGLTTTPDSVAKTVLLHEAVQRTVQFYTNQEDCLRSTLCGRTDIVLPDGSSPYASDGKAGLIGLTNGNNFRGRDRQIFHSLESLVEFINSCWCAGIGFETIDGKQVMVLEHKSHFFNKNSKILSLGKVPPFKRRVDPTRYANIFEYGYAGKVDIGQINAIDEFNTIRRSRIPIVNTKNELKVATKMRTGGYQIESQRRLIGSTEDGKLDDENFAVVLVRDGLDFKSKKDEGYIAFTNVIDSGSGYNYDISPARNAQEWKPVLASGLIRSNSKIITFAKGEVNYTMTSQKTGEAAPLAENGSIDVSGVEPIWDNELYDLKDVPFTRDYMKLIKANPYGYIEFQDGLDNIFEGFIEGVKVRPNENLADLLLLKVYRP